MCTLEYSIIFASIRPEIKERVSIGIIFCQGGIIDLKYSTAKLNAVRNLVPRDDYNYLRRTLSSMSTKKSLDSVACIDYLSRYSNIIPYGLTDSESKNGVRVFSFKGEVV